MIKVMEKGPETFISYCPKCGAKISYQLEDVRNIFGTETYMVNCPICKSVVQHGVDYRNLFDLSKE